LIERRWILLAGANGSPAIKTTPAATIVEAKLR
jgi:hypothetical protein